MRAPQRHQDRTKYQDQHCAKKPMRRYLHSRCLVVLMLDREQHMAAAQKLAGLASRTCQMNNRLAVEKWRSERWWAGACADLPGMPPLL